MPNYTREDLVKKKSTMNQLRNMIYHLIKFIKEAGKNDNDIKARLNRMGKNIAKTEAKFLKFENNDPEVLIKTIYQNILGSKVTISKKMDSDIVVIEDKKCCTCKYHRKDISVAPCELIHSMVSELLKINGLNVIESTTKQSMALGALSCIHTYQFNQ